MDTAQSEKHLTHQPRLRKSLEDIANTPTPFRFFFKIWRLLQTIDRESQEVSEDIWNGMGLSEQRYAKQGILGIVYDIFWEKSDEYKNAKNPEHRKKSRKRCFRLKTRNEWKKPPFRNGILSEFPDILDPKKTHEYDKLCLIRGYYEKKGMPQLQDLAITKTGKWDIVYDLSENAKKEIFEQYFSDAHILRKILTHGKRNDLREHYDHRCAYYDRIAPGRANVYNEGEIVEIDNETREIIKEYYEVHGKTQYNLKIAKKLGMLCRMFHHKRLEVEWKRRVSDPDMLHIITSIMDSVLSPVFLPRVTGKLARNMRETVSKAEMEQYAYLVSNIWADSYEEYLSVQAFFSRLISEMDMRTGFFRNLLRYGSWVLFCSLSYILAPLLFILALLIAVYGFPILHPKGIRYWLSRTDIGFSIAMGVLLLVFGVIGTILIKTDTFVVPDHGILARVTRAPKEHLPDVFQSGSIPLKSSILEAMWSGMEESLIVENLWDGKNSQICYSLGCMIERIERSKTSQ